MYVKELYLKLNNLTHQYIMLNHLYFLKLIFKNRFVGKVCGKEIKIKKMMYRNI